MSEQYVASLAQIAQLPHHPLTGMFRPVSGIPLQALQEDLFEHGQRVPVYTWNGALIDGRARVEALINLGVAHVMVQDRSDVSQASLLRWLWYINNLEFTTRGNDSIAQRAMAGYRLSLMQKESESVRYPVPHMRQDEIATLVRIGKTSISRASMVYRYGTPDLVKRVDNGDLDIETAARLVRSKAGREPTRQDRLRGVTNGSQSGLAEKSNSDLYSQKAYKKTPNAIRSHAIQTVGTMGIVLSEHRNAPLPPPDVADEWLNELEEALTWLNDLRVKLHAEQARRGRQS